MITANCPNCGNGVPFHSEFSTHAVCGYCDSLIVRQDSGLENLGKVAELQQDGSPLQVGTHGEYGGKAFQIVGRIQLKYKDGFWNEWHLYYSNGESGWLGEAMGEYFVCAQRNAGQSLPPAGHMRLGTSLGLGGDTYCVTGSTANQVTAYEGELPFLVETNQPFATFDLRTASGKAATIDYSDSPPTLFIGEFKEFQDFNFSGLRQEGQMPEPGSGMRVPAAAAGVDKFNCPTCGAPHSVDGGVRSKMLVCEYCGSAVDISNSSLNVIWQEEQMRADLQGGTEIGLGSVATIEGREYKMIGYVKKSVTYEGVKYPWTEYLLYSRTNGYRWLVESDGHYTLMGSTDRLPTRFNGAPVDSPNPETVKFEGKDFRHFQTSKAVVDAVAGEFYWRVKRGDSATNFDYVCPPEILSMEASQSSFVWSKGEYKTEDDIREMFGLPERLKARIGVAPPQPNPHLSPSKSIWRTFKACALVGFLLLGSGILSGSSGVICSTKAQTYKTYRANPAQTSEAFELKGHGNVAFKFLGRPYNRWMFVKAELINQKTKKVYHAGATLERFYNKGDIKKTVRVSGIPNGTYKMRWNVESGTTSKTPDKADAKKETKNVGYSITVRRGGRVWGWFFWMIILLLPIPVIMSAKKSSFETRRWYNSDYG